MRGICDLVDLPATEPFLRDVFTDVARMTLGPWVHFGGDEVLVMQPEEFGRFVVLCQEIIAGAGKTPVAWQEAGRSAHGLDPLPPRPLRAGFGMVGRCCLLG